MASNPTTSWQTDGEKVERVTDVISKITADSDYSHKIKRCLCLGKKAMTNLNSILKSRDNTLPTEVCTLKALVFPVVMYGCESWTIKNWCTEEVMLLNCGVEKTLESPLDGKEIQLVHPKGDQSLFIGRTDVEGETPILWPPDAKCWLIWKDRDVGKDWRQEEKGMTDLDIIFKSRDITLLTNVCIVKAMVFPVVMYGCESWTINDECWRTDAFELWCWKRLLRVPWTARRSNQSILKEVNPEYSLEGLMLKLNVRYLATWCEDLTHWKRPWYWEGLRAGGKREKGGWDGRMPSQNQWTWVWANSGR